MTTTIPEGLKAYIPPSYLQGGELKAGIDADAAIQVAQGIQAKAETLPPAQKALFLAMVAAADIAPGGKIPEDFSKSLDIYANASNLVAKSGKIQDALDILARVMVEQAGEQRHNALQDRLNARDQAKTELLNQATSLQNQASELKDGALKAMVLAVVFSSVSIVASVVSVVGAAGGALSSAGKITLGSAGEAMAGSSQGLGGLATSLSQLGQGVSGYESTTAQANAKDKEAQGQIDAAEAQTLQSQADIKKEAQDALNDMIKAIMNFLKELADAKAQHMQVMTKV